MGATTLWKDDFEAAGYRPYRDSLKGQGEAHVPLDQRMYQGSMQKRVQDEKGTRYFVNVDFYDFSRVTYPPSMPRSLSAHVQFSVQDRMARVADVGAIDGESPAAIEAFFADLWQRMGWGYYEREEAWILPSTTSPQE